MSILMAIAGSALSVGSFWMLITNVSGACSGVVGLATSLSFVVCAVVGAEGWKRIFTKKA